MQGKIINITRFCTDDGPGIRTTVFLKGCPLGCVWCHNPESQKAEVESYCDGEVIGKTVSVQDVISELVRDKAFYQTSNGGVTISGGEPLFQPEFTTRILKACKEQGIHTAIETSGFATKEIFSKVIEYCDLVLFDIKETNEINHKKYTGVELAPILANLKMLDEMQVEFIIRLPVVPSVNDRAEHFFKVKEWVQDMKCCKGIEIMPYHRLGEYKYERLGREYFCKGIEEPDKQQVETWKRSVK